MKLSRNVINFCFYVYSLSIERKSEDITRVDSADFLDTDDINKSKWKDIIFDKTKMGYVCMCLLHELTSHMTTNRFISDFIWRASALFDAVTDIYVLYLLIINDSVLVTMASFFSICTPFVVCWSAGLRFLANRCVIFGFFVFSAH